MEVCTRLHKKHVLIIVLGIAANHSAYFLNNFIGIFTDTLSQTNKV
jgi:hypothetical protein